MKVFSLHFEAIQLSIKQLVKGDYWLYIIPSVVIAFLFYRMFGFVDDLSDSSSSLDSVPWVGSWLSSGAKYTLGFFDMILMILFKFFILTILSPVNSFLSEKVETVTTGKTFETNALRILNDLVRTVFIVAFSTFAYFFCIALWWLISWLPFMSYLDGFMYFAISAFYLGFNFYDYSLERHKVNFFYSWGFGFEKIGYMILTGAIFSLFFMIPSRFGIMIGVILAPFFLTIVSTHVYILLNASSTENNYTSNE
jgi:CysZ protein